MSQEWYVLKIHPLCENRAAKELEQDGLEVFLPRLKESGYRKETVDSPLFPGYLFVKLNPEETGWPIFRMRHKVIGWVRFGDVIPSVADDTILGLVGQVNSRAWDSGFWKRYKEGESVRVVSGSVETNATVVEDAKSPESRVRVLLEFMGRMIEAKVPWVDLQPDCEITGRGNRIPRKTRGKGRRIREHRPDQMVLSSA